MLLEGYCNCETIWLGPLASISLMLSGVLTLGLVQFRRAVKDCTQSEEEVQAGPSAAMLLGPWVSCFKCWFPMRFWKNSSSMLGVYEYPVPSDPPVPVAPFCVLWGCWELKLNQGWAPSSPCLWDGCWDCWTCWFGWSCRDWLLVGPLGWRISRSKEVSRGRLFPLSPVVDMLGLGLTCCRPTPLLAPLLLTWPGHAWLSVPGVGVSDSGGIMGQDGGALWYWFGRTAPWLEGR